MRAFQKIEERMESDIEWIYARRAIQETEIANLRRGHGIVNKRCSESIQLLNTLAKHSLEATKRSSIAA